MKAIFFHKNISISTQEFVKTPDKKAELIFVITVIEVFVFGFKVYKTVKLSEYTRY